MGGGNTESRPVAKLHTIEVIQSRKSFNQGMGRWAV